MGNDVDGAAAAALPFAASVTGTGDQLLTATLALELHRDACGDQLIQFHAALALVFPCAGNRLLSWRRRDGFGKQWWRRGWRRRLGLDFDLERAGRHQHAGAAASTD